MSDYDPKYISPSDIPVQIPDDYDRDEKLDAIEFAEAMLELDVNGGEEIADGDLTPYHIAALKQKGTCELAKGAEDNDDVALADLDDTGDTKVDYSMQAFCERYKEIVDGIQSALENEYTGVYVYNTSPSEDWSDWDRYFNDVDFDLDVEDDYDV